MSKKKRSAKPTVILVACPSTISACMELLLAKQEYRVLSRVEDRDAALAAVTSNQPDLVILDTGLVPHDPFQIAKKIAAENPETKMAFMSDVASEGLVRRIRKLSALGLVSLSESEADLMKGLGKITGGTEYFAKRFRKHVEAADVPKKKEGITRLSPRELEVLRYLAQDFSVKEVAELVGIGPTTVETHRQSLRSKLDMRGHAKAARIAVSEGLV